MLFKRILLIISIFFLSMSIFCELSSNVDLTVGGGYSFYRDIDSPINPGNILEIEEWDLKFPLRNITNLYWDNIFSLTLNHEMYLGIIEDFHFVQYTNYQLFKLNELYISSSFGTSFFNIVLGKLAPEFGVGYIRKSQSYFKRLTDDYSKWMVNTQLIKDSFFLEFYYAPFRDFIPDDYTKKESLEKCNDIIGFSSNSYLGDFYWQIVGFYDEDFFTGLSFSSEIIVGLLLYSDITFTNKHWIDRIIGDGLDLKLEKLEKPYMDIMFGINYTPSFLNWSFYFETRYNQDGLTTSEMSDFSDKLLKIDNLNNLYPGFGLPFYGSLADRLPFNSLSLLSFALHSESFDYIKGFLKIKNTTFFSIPAGFMNQLTLEIPLFDNIKINGSWSHITDLGEYKYFLYRDSLKFSIKYNIYK